MAVTRYFIPVGAVKEYKGVKLKAMISRGNQPTCEGCYFRARTQYCYGHGFLCTSHQRKDKNHVVFVKVD